MAIPIPAPQTGDALLGRDLEHRKSILIAFRDRAQIERVLKEAGVDSALYRNAYNSLLDSAMVTCRALWEMIGVVVPSHKEQNTAIPTVKATFHSWKNTVHPKLPGDIVITPFDEAQFDTLPEKPAIILVLVAANKCVAHLDCFPDHGVGDKEMEQVVGVTLREIDARVKKKV
jgi:hypothetical protein